MFHFSKPLVVQERRRRSRPVTRALHPSWLTARRHTRFKIYLIPDASSAYSRQELLTRGALSQTRLPQCFPIPNRPLLHLPAPPPGPGVLPHYKSFLPFPYLVCVGGGGVSLSCIALLCYWFAGTCVQVLFCLLNTFYVLVKSPLSSFFVIIFEPGYDKWGLVQDFNLWWKCSNAPRL